MYDEQTLKRFWDKVDKADGCWEWTACLKKGKKGNGYGFFWLHGKNFRAHRFSWIINFGNISDGLCVLHRCDNRRCVRPDHLFLGTVTDNNVDAIKKGRIFCKDKTKFLNLI